MFEKMMKVQTFFGLFPLRSGTIFIGAATVVYALTAIIGSSLRYGFYLNCRNGPSNPSEYEGLYVILLTVLIISMIFTGITGALMIYGARKKAPGYIFLWLARSTTEIVIMCTAFITFLIWGLLGLSIAIYLGYLVSLALAIGLYTYIVLVVYNFYKQLTVEKYSNVGFSNEEKLPIGPLNDYHPVA